MHDSEQEHLQGTAEPEQTAERPPQARPRIYVAGLSDYNAGRLHGVWLEAAQEAEELQAGITAMLETSPKPVAEEWAIHDHEGFGRMHLGEYESLETVSTVALGIVEHGPAFAAWADLQYPLDPSALVDFEAAFRGTWENVEAYAEDLLEDLGATAELERIPEWLQPYVRLDVAAYARDLELGGDICTVRDEEGVHIFDATI